MPKRIILTTCGTSLLESSCWITNDNTLESISSMQNKTKWEREVMKGYWASWINGQNETNLVSTFNIDYWTNNNLIDLPAELASLKAIKTFFKSKKDSQGITHPLNQNDEIILLHSDNTEGLFCGKVIEKLIKDYKLLQPVNVIRQVIVNLDPSNKENFLEALKAVITYVKSLIPQNSNLILNLTAGYKGTAILLGGLAGKNNNIKIFYLHEEAGYDQIFDMEFTGTNIRYGLFDLSTKKPKETLGPPL